MPVLSTVHCGLCFQLGQNSRLNVSFEVNKGEPWARLSCEFSVLFVKYKLCVQLSVSCEHI